MASLQTITLLLACFFLSTQAFQPSCNVITGSGRCLNMHFEESTVGNTALSERSLLRERYLATNRFKVKQSKEAAFEKRWADRESKLAKLDGFRFFTLLRRVEAQGVKYDKADSSNYVSFTVWEDKDSFDVWRTGSAFKEAHGGGGLSGFIGLLTTALFILDGSPKPAFYDTLRPQTNEVLSFADAAESGWRKVSADGVSLLTPEIFVAQARMQVPEGAEGAFEDSIGAFAASPLQPGLVGRFTQRRDASKADDGYNYMVTSIWKDQAAYQASLAAPAPLPGRGVAGVGSPALAFFEGKLTLASAQGI